MMLNDDTENKKQILALLKKESLTEVGFLPFSETSILQPRLVPPDAKSVILLLAPYDDGIVYQDGVSAYARIYDYHRFYKELYERLLPELEIRFPKHHFWGFADHSPINEKEAAAKAGLGVIGCNSLLLNPVYGSYVFIGSLLTDLQINCTAQEISYCNHCGACLEACPGNAVTETGILPERCISALSQKKRLSEEELHLLRELNIAWGCDKCQEVCPYNLHRSFTEVPFFLKHRHGAFTFEEIEAMSEEEFSRYAFSWRGRKRITENLKNLSL